MKAFIVIPILLSLLFTSVKSFKLRPKLKPAQQHDVLKGVPQPQAGKEPLMQYDDIAVGNTFARSANFCFAGACKWPKSGHYLYIPYYICSNYTLKEKNIIIHGLQTFNRFTCIRFVPWNFHDSDYIHFFSEPKQGCWSYLGYHRGGQYISLEKEKCVFRSTVQHEVLHALGFNHEQVRIDRDKYVQILFKNIKPEEKYNFRKVETNNLGTPYDYKSVMHYNKYAFSKNSLPTILTKSTKIHSTGNRYGMSKTDIARLNKLYNCRKQ